MDSLKIISDINERLNTLDNKVEKTSKSASIAFSYLYEKINAADKCVDTFKELDTKVSYISNDFEKNNIYTYSYYTSLNSNLLELKLDSEGKYKDITIQVDSITNKFDEISNEIDAINKRLDDIIERPYNYILVEKEPPIIAKIFNKIGVFFYKALHYKQIKNEIIRQEQEEIRIKEEKEKQAKLEEIARQERLKQEKIAKQNKIKNLLKQ